MSKPWLETWRASEDGEDVVTASKKHGYLVCVARETEDVSAFISAAPDMCRALLRIEKHDGPHHCSCCLLQNEPGGCWLNEALTKAGLVTQKQRDEARKELGI